VNKIKVGIVGISGYTGLELARILAGHPVFELGQVTSRKLRGTPLAELYPFLTQSADLTITDLDQDGLAKDVDLFFLAVPHGAAMDTAAKLIKAGKKVVDLSADFRLKCRQTYEQWYQLKHSHPELLPQAVYGLPEIYSAQIKDATLVANPGCYPSSVILALYPGLKQNLFELEQTIIIDSKSGTTGAGKKPKENLLFCEVYDNFFAYNLGKHRHTPEIEQELSSAQGSEVKVLFSVHLLPINRGILSTIYVQPKASLAEIREVYENYYQDKPWVKILPSGLLPQTKWVKGTMHCLLGLDYDQKTNKIIIVSVIDNLCRGASGQAIANANLMSGLELDTGLNFQPFLP